MSELERLILFSLFETASIVDYFPYHDEVEARAHLMEDLRIDVYNFEVGG